MPETLIMERQGGRLAPKTAVDAEALERLPSGDLKVTVVRAKDTRSVEQNNLRWKVCEVIADNVEGWTKDGVNDALKIATGHVTYARAPNGTFWRFPKPTDFAAMGAAEFTEWLDRAFAAIGELFGEGLSDAAREELDALINGTITQAEAA